MAIIKGCAVAEVDPNQVLAVEGSTRLSLEPLFGRRAKDTAMWPHKRLAASGWFAIGSRPRGRDTALENSPRGEPRRIMSVRHRDPPNVPATT